jgi:hypothetical protein
MRKTRLEAFSDRIVMTLNGMAWAALWLYGSSRRRLLADDFPAR